MSPPIAAPVIQLFPDRTFSERDDASVDTKPGGPQPPDMDDTWRTKVDEKLAGLDKGLSDIRVTVAELKGDISGLKVAAGALISVTAIGFAVLGGFVYTNSNALSSRMDRVEAKVDAIVPRMTEEFRAMLAEDAADARAMRAEQSAQTSAIANSITATKQQAPQVILVPASQVQQPTTTAPPP